MDNLKDLRAGVQVVEGFSAIHFRCYILVKVLQTARTPKKLDNTPKRIQILEHTRAKLLEAKSLVSIDVHTGGLWLFGATDADVASKRAFLDECLASAINKQADSGLHWLLTLDNTEQFVFVENDRESETGFGVIEASQAVMGQVSASGFNFRRFYGLFLTAIISTISYSLARNDKIIPLNFCTFVATCSPSSANTHSSDKEGYNITGIHLSTLKAQLTSGGSVIISSLSKFQPNLRQVCHYHPCGCKKRPKHSKLIRIAPNGIVARLYCTRKDPLESSSNSDEDSADYLGWHSSVDIWLRQRGIHLKNLDDDHAWTKIIISNKSGVQVLEWPVDLCFYYEKQSMQVGDGFLAVGADNGQVQADYEDSLEFTRTWITEKNIREKELENRQVRRIEEAAVEKKQSLTDQTASPFGRSGPFGDPQVVSGVYPTPPDGLPPHVIANYQFGTSSQPIENSATPEGSAAQIFDLEGGMTVDTPPKDQQMQSRAMSIDFETGASGEFFMDPDGDLLEAADMNEMDFSYFDEPDDDQEKIILDGNDTRIETEGLADTTIPKRETSSPRVDVVYEPPTIISADLSAPHIIHAAPSNKIRDLTRVDPIYDKGFDDTGPNMPPVVQSQIPKAASDKPPSSSLENDNQAPATSRKPISNLDAVSFNSQLEVFDEKYDLGGRFGGLYTSPTKKRWTNTPALRGIPRLHSHTGKTTSPSKNNGSGLPGNVEAEAGLDVMELSNDAETDHSYDSMTSSSSYEAVAWRPVRVLESPRYAKPIMRLRNGNLIDENQIRPAVPDLSRISKPSKIAHSISSVISCLYHLTTTKPLDWSLVDFPGPRIRNRTDLVSIGAPPNQHDMSSKSDYMDVAQILLDQLTLSSILHSPENGSERNIQNEAVQLPILQSYVIQEAISRCFTRCKKEDLFAYISIEGNPAEISRSNQELSKSNLPRSTSLNSPVTRLPSPRLEHALVRIPTPHVRITKTDVQWEVLPPALAFWDTLGLGPCNGPKNITTYCIYPFGKDLDTYVETFLNTIGSMYETLKLGLHAMGDESNAARALVPVRILETVSKTAILASIRETCVNFARSLAKMKKVSRYTVIYMVNPFEGTSSLGAICSCFKTLFQNYHSAFVRGPIKTSLPVSNLVLQVVPLNMIATPDHPIVLDADKTAKLAREVYDRCRLASNANPQLFQSMQSEAAIQLEPSMPKAIQFQPIPEAPSELLKENSYLHIAYSCSIDENWIAAAWIDSTGENQATASYCLAGGRKFVEIAQEIWETTLDIIKTRKVTWRLFLAKAGRIAREEKNIWIDLIQRPKSAVTRMLMFTIDTDPILAVTPKVPQLDSNTMANAMAQSIQHGTPVNTPGPFPSTPDQFGPAPTPPSGPPVTASTPTETLLGPEIDPYAILTDVMEESWSIVLLHQLNTAPSTIDYDPALASGYLMKRCTPGENEGMRLLEVNLIHCELTGAIQSQRAYDALLREGIFLYSNLAVLATARGVESSGSVRPWHIAAVMKGAEGLSRHMHSI